MFTSLHYQFQSSGGAGPNTQRIAVAQVAFGGFACLRVVDNDLPWAVGGAQSASDAGVRVYDPGPGFFIQADGLDRAYVLTKRVLALLAQNGLVHEIFPLVFDAQGSQSGIESPAYPLRANQLAYLAPGAQVEMRYQAQSLGCLECLVHKKSL